MSNRYDKLLQEVINEAKQINIPISSNIDSNVLINTRAKGRFGQCKRRNGKFIIELSIVFEQAEDCMAKQTLAHEVLHTCKDCFNHQTLWKSYASKMNRAYGYNITRTNSVANIGVSDPIIKKARNYTIQCQRCNKEFYRERVSNLIKHPERYRCKCGGTLVVK